MVTAVLFGYAGSSNEGSSDLMQRPPRDPKKPLLTFPLLMRTGLVTLISLAGAFGLFAWEHGAEGRNLDEARAAVVNVIVMMQTAYLLSCRSRTRAALSASLFSNRWMLAGIRRDVVGTDPLHLPAVYEPPFSQRPRFEPKHGSTS